MIRGSCLCAGVKYEISGKVSPLGQCHCSLCRKASGTASNAALLTARGSLRWVQGEELVQVYTRPTGWRSAFCRVCGSPTPLLHESGKVFGVPAGTLDDDPGTRVEQHYFVGSKAAWEEIGGDASQYDEAPPPYRKT
jgi:hypothetical protein